MEGINFSVQTDHKPLTYAFQTKREKATPPQTRQLSFISEVTSNIKHIQGNKNKVADVLLRIQSTSLPTAINAEELTRKQQEDTELQVLLKSNRTSLKLESPSCDDRRKIACDTSLGLARPFFSKANADTSSIFSTSRHTLADAQRAKQKYRNSFGLECARIYIFGPISAYPAIAPKSQSTQLTRCNRSQYKTANFNTYT